jgi:hypothetical protein
MANKIIKFSIEPDYEFMVYAIVSSVKEYTFAWHLNTSLEIDLHKEDDLELPHTKESNKYVSNYVYHSEYSTLRILRNKLVGETLGYLLPELNKFDFLLKIEGESVEEMFEDLPQKLKSLPCVQYFEKLKIENLKSKDNLLF